MAEVKEFFNLKEKLRESIQEQKRFLVNEMSLLWDDPYAQVLNDINSNNTQYKFIKRDGRLVENKKLDGTEYEIYSYPGTNQICLAFLTQGLVAALVEFNQKSSDSIKIKYICKMSSFRRLMSVIFIKYLLKKYKEIESDNLHTVEAYNFYYKLAFDQNYEGDFSMFLRTPRGDTPIIDTEQMKTSSGKDNKLFNNVYVLKKR